MSSPRLVTAGSRTAAARAFARSLNILLKYVRLYGIDHKLSTSQFETAWRELRCAMPTATPGEGGGGFLFGVSGAKLLLDGVALETGPAERSFAQLLSAAGLASIYFSVEVTRDDFLLLVNAFADAGSRPAAIAAQLRRTFGGGNGPIRVNEIRYVPQDSSEPMMARLTVQALGDDSEKFKDWLSDPEKLLQLIAAAEGESGGGTGGQGSGIERETVPADGGVSSSPIQVNASGPGSENRSGAGRGPGRGNPLLKQDDVTNVLKLLSQLGKVLPGGGGAVDPAQLREQVKNSPFSVKAIFQTVLAQLATQTPSQSDPNVLVRVAEYLAIQFALERFERGEVRVNAVRELLDKMGREIDALRSVLREHEEKMGRAGILVESYTEVLDRQFWAAVPENGKRAVLLSQDAWCIPPRNIRDYVRQLLERGDTKTAASILDTYSSCIRSADVEARRRTAVGLNELAELYAQVDLALLRAALQNAGEQLQVESVVECQTLLSATVVRLAQEAAAHSDFLAVGQALDCSDRLEQHRGELGKDVRRRISVESRIRQFVGDVLLQPEIPSGFIEFLRREPRVATDELAIHYSRCNRREGSERLVQLARSLGPDASTRLIEVLRARPAPEAASCVGLLTHLDVDAVRQLLPERLPQWGRSIHDAVVRQIGIGAAESRGSLLLDLLDLFDPVILPTVIDEIGVTNDSVATVRLLRLAEGELPPNASPYVQVKAIEALARLRDANAAPLFRHLLSARGLLGWKHPREVRIVAAQALTKLDPEFPIAGKYGLSAQELQLVPMDSDASAGWVRQRRYFRVAAEPALPAVLQAARGRCGVSIDMLSLGGGKGARDGRMNPGTEATLNFQVGMRNLNSRVLVRQTGNDDMAFEIIHIDLEERLRLRRLLLDQMLHHSPRAAGPQVRSVASATPV